MPKFQSIIVISIDPETDLNSHLGIDVIHPHIDTQVYRPDPSIGIGVIKNILASAHHRPLKNDTKTIVIIGADKLTLPAQNSLLKLLEEPPTHLTILLVAPTLQSFLDTVVSRCQILRLSATTSTHDTDSKLSHLLSLNSPQRLAALPPLKSKDVSLSFCLQLVASAESDLNRNPNHLTLHNLHLLTQCLDALQNNANPGISITDTILRLLEPTSIATMTKLPGILVD